MFIVNLVEIRLRTNTITGEEVLSALNEMVVLTIAA
jgi:hypothetical protein